MKIKFSKFHVLHFNDLFNDNLMMTSFIFSTEIKRIDRALTSKDVQIISPLPKYQNKILWLYPKMYKISRKLLDLIEKYEINELQFM